MSSGFPLPLVPQPDSSPWKPSPWARSPLGGEGVGSVLAPAPAARPRRTAPPVGPRPAAGRSRHPSPSFCQGLRPMLLPGCARTVKRGSPLVFLSCKGDVSSTLGELYASLSCKRDPAPFCLIGEFPSNGFTGPLTPYEAGTSPPTLLQAFPPYKVVVSMASGGPECPVIGHRCPSAPCML